MVYVYLLYKFYDNPRKRFRRQKQAAQSNSAFISSYIDPYAKLFKLNNLITTKIENKIVTIELKQYLPDPTRKSEIPVGRFIQYSKEYYSAFLSSFSRFPFMYKFIFHRVLINIHLNRSSNIFKMLYSSVKLLPLFQA